MSRTQRRARLLLGGVLALLALGLVPTAAHADSALIDSLDTTGKTDWVTGVSRTFVVSGTTSTELRVYIKVRDDGPTPCADSAESDSGSYWAGYDGDTRVNGNFDKRDVFASSQTGTKLFCIWLASDYPGTAKPFTQKVTFRAPSGTVSGTVNPTVPAPSQPATLTVTGATEAPEDLYVKVRAAGTPCAPTASTDSGSWKVDGRDVNGNFSVPVEVTQSTAGAYVACVWVADASDDPTPTAGPQTIPFTVATPAPAYTPPASTGPSAECVKANAKMHKAAKRVRTTKRKLLRAKRRSTRRKLTRRIRVQRRTLRARIQTARTICG